MINLANFRTAAAGAGNAPEALISLSSDGSELKVSTGKRARAAAWFQTTRNQEVTGRFLESLRREYGAEVARAAYESNSFDRRWELGKPLRARLVHVIMLNARSLKENLVAGNRQILGNYYEPTERGPATDMLRQMIGEKVSACYPSCPESAQFFDPNRIAELIKDEIIAAGQDGVRRVTDDEAANLVKGVIEREFDTYARALDRLGVVGGGSMIDRALADAAGESLPLWFDPKLLAPSEVDALNLRVKMALAGGRIPREQLDDDALRSLAQRVAKEYVAERLADLQMVGELPLAPQIRELLEKDVLYSELPTNLAVAMGEVYPDVRRDLALLGERLDCPESRDVVIRLGNVIGEALSVARVRGGLENQSAVRNCWRFLLAAGGTQLAGNIADRVLAEDSPLRAMGEGTNWFLKDFLDSPEARGIRQPDGEPVYGLPAYSQALLLSKVMNGLAEAAQDTVPDRRGPPGFQNRSADRLSDEEVAVLRNLCVPIPAPNRIGKEGRSVPLSDSTILAIRDNIDEQGQRARSLETKFGVVRESLEGLQRARLEVDKILFLPGKDYAVPVLWYVCSDKQGNPNAELLKQVSSITSERTFDSIQAACFDSKRPDRAVFAGRPVTTHSRHPDYSLDTDSYGGMTLNLVDKLAISQLDFESAGANAARSLAMDPDRSFLVIDVTIHIDAGTCTPEVRNVILKYELSPRSTAGEGSRAGEVAPGPAAAAGFEQPDDHIYEATPGDPGDRPAVVEQMAAREPRSGALPRTGSGARGDDVSYDIVPGALPRTGSGVDNPGASARPPVAADDAISAENRAKLLVSWREQMFQLRDQTIMRQPSSRSRAQPNPRAQERSERANALHDVEGFMAGAIKDLAARRDPTLALLNRAAELEARRFIDGGTGGADAARLRSMAREYEALR